MMFTYAVKLVNDDYSTLKITYIASLLVIIMASSHLI